MCRPAAWRAKESPLRWSSRDRRRTGRRARLRSRQPSSAATRASFRRAVVEAYDTGAEGALVQPGDKIDEAFEELRKEGFLPDADEHEEE
jgi:hypothetical protein